MWTSKWFGLPQTTLRFNSVARYETDGIHILFARVDNWYRGPTFIGWLFSEPRIVPITLSTTQILTSLEQYDSGIRFQAQ